MATNVFISFRFSDGNDYKQKLDELFKGTDNVINYSESKDRSGQSEDTIKQYLYNKLKETSITIVILTPEAVHHKRNNDQIDDWMYDELRYSLEDREDNRTNGVIALYTELAKPDLMQITKCNLCNNYCDISRISFFTNLVRKNMMNIKHSYKFHKCENVYDELNDSYISLVPFNKFVSNYQKYIDNALEKRDRTDQFDLVKKI